VSDIRAIADRVEIETLRGEFTDAAMMRDRARLASLFTHDGALRMPNIPAELIGRDQIRAGASGCRASGEFFVQTTHPGTIQLDGDTASGRAYPRARPRPRRPPGAEPRHLPRPLPAHRRRLEVHRAGLRGQILSLTLSGILVAAA
jgi:ketosteroid isomerase-like protein